jgi:hypothetical protein
VNNVIRLGFSCPYIFSSLISVILQAMLLGVVAENPLPFTMVPVLIQLTQELAKDKTVLVNLSMDRTSASYKMNYGLRKTIESDIIQDIRGTPFSLNIDEATSNNNKHVLSILVSYYSQAEKTNSFRTFSCSRGSQSMYRLNIRKIGSLI